MARKEKTEKNQETEVGGRGSEAVRHRNCQFCNNEETSMLGRARKRSRLFAEEIELKASVLRNEPDRTRTPFARADEETTNRSIEHSDWPGWLDSTGDDAPPRQSVDNTPVACSGLQTKLASHINATTPANMRLFKTTSVGCGFPLIRSRLVFIKFSDTCHRLPHSFPQPSTFHSPIPLPLSLLNFKFQICNFKLTPPPPRGPISGLKRT